ncbi:Hypothetical predicted protein [Mytilus galloprovincialis]|uniref:Poly [ADP-ribose] polymerase n=1 Tax=Mytilus galloprovincialis TaxID=29158 RepID=A0A8B6FD16_MYTGA|nr:Hypothetical predicted protein [Mytilus galloprovincialis]
MGQSESVVDPHLGNSLLGFQDNINARNMISTMAELRKCQQIHHKPYTIELKTTEVTSLTGHLYIDMQKHNIKTPPSCIKNDRTKTLRTWNCHSIFAKTLAQVQVSPEERSTIKTIVKNTWRKQFAEHGRDLWGLNTSIQLERIEKSQLAELYFESRETKLHKIGKSERTFVKLKDISCETSGAMFTANKANKSLSVEMGNIVNEHYSSNGTLVGYQFSSFRGYVRKTRSMQKPASTAKLDNSASFIDIGNISVSVITGNLAEQEADIIINIVTADVDLTKGLESNEISEFSGLEIPKESEDDYLFGDVAITSGGQFKCSRVYHVALPQWNDNEQELQKIIKIFFDYIRNSNEKIKNVVIPPLGHGFWGFPDDVIAKNMISTIVELGKDSQIHHVSIKVVCHRREHSVFKVLKKEVEKLTEQLYQEMYVSDLKPPLYWTLNEHTKTFKEWNCQSINKRCCELVQVSQRERFAIESLVKDTWKAEFVGIGRDSRGLEAINYRNIEILNVERIENPSVAERYFQCRARMCYKVGHFKRHFPKLEEIGCSSGPILTSRKTNNTLKRGMVHMVNEHYLFHGTTVNLINNIADQGFDQRLSNGMFGAGIYAAESPTKCDQYAGKNI